MATKLTSFPDGEGYMENVWDGLTPVQEAALGFVSGHRSRPREAKSGTYARLVWYGLITPHAHQMTERGQALVDWAWETGRWPS